MKKFLSIFTILFSFVTSAQQEDVHVRSYIRNDGTYIPNHYRTQKNETINDNYTTQGNVNPYTGKAGTIPRESTYNTYKPATTKPVKTHRSTTPSSTPSYNYSTTTYPQYNSKPKATKRKSANSYYIY